MSNGTAKDDNGMPVIYGVSHLDGVTPIQIHFTATGAMLTDTTTTIAFNPTIIKTQNSTMYPFALATSSVDDSTIAPFVVNASTGAVLVDE